MGDKGNLIEEARRRAEDVLKGNARSIGLLSARTAYQQVNGRDAMICGLGLMLLNEPWAWETHRHSMESLAGGQSRLGNIPFGVGFPDIPDESFIATGGTFATSKNGNGRRPVVDTIHAGCVDNCLWYILGHYVYYQMSGDVDFLRRFWRSLERAYLWLQYQDVNECGLLEVHEAMDWADLFANRYNVLYDNVLWCAVHRAMHVLPVLGEETSTLKEAHDCRQLNLCGWVRV